MILASVYQVGYQCYIYFVYITKDIKEMLAWFCAKVKMCKFTHRLQTFIQFSPNFFLEINNPIYLTVINQILFSIVVHIKMMFWMCLIFMLHQWHCSMCIRSKSKAEIHFFPFKLTYEWHAINGNMDSDINWNMFVVVTIIWKVFTFGFLVTLQCPVSEKLASSASIVPYMGMECMMTSWWRHSRPVSRYRYTWL